MAGLVRSRNAILFQTFWHKGTSSPSDHILFHQSLSRDWSLPLKWLRTRSKPSDNTIFEGPFLIRLSSWKYSSQHLSPLNRSEMFCLLAEFSSFVPSLLLSLNPVTSYSEYATSPSYLVFCCLSQAHLFSAHLKTTSFFQPKSQEGSPHWFFSPQNPRSPYCLLDSLDSGHVLPSVASHVADIGTN